MPNFTGYKICKYYLQKKISEGSFGQVYSVKDTIELKEYALKIENFKVINFVIIINENNFFIRKIIDH